MDSQAYMRQALIAATESPDPSTQNGAVLLTPRGAVSACNTFPHDVAFTDDRWERPKKYSFIEHAERNAIYKAARGGYATNDSMMFAPWAACADCARAIIQAGVATLVRFTVLGQTNERWDESIRLGDEMMHEAGVHIITIMATGNFGISLRRNGEELIF